MAHSLRVCEDEPQPRPRIAYRAKDRQRAVAVLHIGGMDDGADHQARRVGRDMALAALDPFAGVIAANSTSFGSFYALTAITPAVGVASRPSSSRAAITSRPLIETQRPSSRQK